MGEVTGKKRHNVTYNASGQNPKLHPELRRFKHLCGGDERAAPQLMRPRITLDDIQELSTVLVGNMEKFEDSPEASKFRRSLQRARDLPSAVKQAQFLLGHVYQVTWLLLP